MGRKYKHVGTRTDFSRLSLLELSCVSEFGHTDKQIEKKGWIFPWNVARSNKPINKIGQCSRKRIRILVLGTFTLYLQENAYFLNFMNRNEKLIWYILNSFYMILTIFKNNSVDVKIIIYFHGEFQSTRLFYACHIWVIYSSSSQIKYDRRILIIKNLILSIKTTIVV